MYQLRAIALIFICFFPLLLEEDASAGEDVPVDGGRLVLGTIGEPSNLNPYISTDSASHDVADLLFIAPIRYNKNLELEPFAELDSDTFADRFSPFLPIVAYERLSTYVKSSS